MFIINLVLTYTLTQANAPALLGRLQIPGEVLTDIRTALAAGFEVVVPERIPVKAVGVSGIGYQIRDPVTGSASYRIAGGTDGADAQTACAERQRQPLAQAIVAIVLTAVVIALLIAAGVYIGGLIAGASAGAGGVAGAALTTALRLQLARVMAGVGLTALTFPATAGNDFCSPINIPRKGGPQGYRSGLCADSLGNIYPGQDVCVNGVAFDALTSANTLWEVKVIDFTNAPDLVIDFQISGEKGDLAQLTRQKEALAACPVYLLAWAVADLRHFLRQKSPYGWDLLANIHKYVPDCFNLPTSPIVP